MAWRFPREKRGTCSIARRETSASSAARRCSLPDPRREVIVRKVLDPKNVELLFPGNKEALEYNARLSALKRSEAGNEFVIDDEARQASQRKGSAEVSEKKAEAAFVGDAVSRNQTFTAPRTIVLDNRFEGAVSIDLWTGYAVLVKSRAGKRRVEVGPTTFLLEYDETLQAMELSTGTPKNDDKTDAHCVPAREEQQGQRPGRGRDQRPREGAHAHVVPGRLRGRRGAVVLRRKLREVPHRSPALALASRGQAARRRALLRQRRHHLARRDPRAAAEDGKRPGRRFSENGMRVYDVEVLGVSIGDETIAKLLVDAQHASVQQALAVAAERRRLELTRAREAARQESATLEASTKLQLLDIEGREVERKHAVELARIKAETDIRERTAHAQRSRCSSCSTRWPPRSSRASARGAVRRRGRPRRERPHAARARRAGARRGGEGEGVLAGFDRGAAGVRRPRARGEDGREHGAARDPRRGASSSARAAARRLTAARGPSAPGRS